MLPLLPIRQLGARSSILQHAFPAFYACYLLKSIQTPQSTTVYIGSTPSPPRRIRQHNGELTQGARKTQRKRPWVMQMIVHGFPSRLAALQFEWAWQHPHKSRHMRDSTGRLFGERRSKAMKKNVAIVRSMISRHPFNRWPLHVKLFTEEAVNHWAASARMPNVAPLPPGFTCAVELEGVDGKSGHPGSGRTGPIEVDDAEFTAALLAKNTALLASGLRPDCTVCHAPLDMHASNALSTALCPHAGCTAASHLACLAQSFLAEEGGAGTEFIPRGGHCAACEEYTLWGDVVRGCYRRLPPSGQDVADIASDDMFVSDEEPATPARRKAGGAKLKRKRLGGTTGADSSEGESFDFDGITTSSDGASVKRTPGRPRIVRVAGTTPKPRKARALSTTPRAKPGPKPKPKTVKAKGKARASTPDAMMVISSEGEAFDFDNIVSSSDSDGATPAKRRPGRPRASPPATPPRAKPGPKPKPKATSMSAKAKGKARAATPDAMVISSEGESFDFDNISSSSDSAPPSLVRRSPGRPRKVATTASAPAPPSPVRRSPGRPRKAATATTAPAPPSPVRRSPGRPRKLPAPALPTRSSPPKTPRSKPPAHKNTARASPAKTGARTSGTESPPGGRASIVPPPPKRKPGRPRRDSLPLRESGPSALPARAPVRPFHSQAQAGRPLLPRAGPTSPDSGSASSDVEILEVCATGCANNGRVAGQGVNCHHAPNFGSPGHASYPPNPMLDVDEALAQALAYLSVGTPHRSQPAGSAHRATPREIEVIELSD